MLRAALIATVLAMPMPASAAYHLFIEHDGDADRNSVAYTGCDDPGIWHECVYFTVGCDSDGGWLELIDGGHVASRLLADPYPQTINFDVGSRSFETSVWQFDVGFNDMDGGWVVEFDRLENHDVFDALRISDGPFSATIAGVRIDLTPRDADRGMLQSMASVCAMKLSEP